MQPKIRKLKKDEKRAEFLLRVVGKSLGNHNITIVCDNAFFDIAEIPNLQNGLVNLQIEMEVQEKMLHLAMHFSGKVVLPCDRCLDPVEVPLDFDEELIVKIVDHTAARENDDNMWFISDNVNEIDIFHFVYESISLALPHRIVHEEDENGNSTCNPDILERLNALTKKADDDIDPRWEALKKLK